MYKKRNQAACINETCPNMSKKLLSGKAKKQQLAEKREKERKYHQHLIFDISAIGRDFLCFL